MPKRRLGIPGVGMPKTRLGILGVGMPRHRQWRVSLIPPTEPGELLTDWSCVPRPMVQGWRSTEEMHAETLAHSTKQMRKTKTWRKLSGGKKRVYVCTTYDTNPKSCPYRITWTKKVLGGRIDCSTKEYKRMNKGPRDYAWRLNLDECMWQHDMCPSKMLAWPN